MSEEIKCFCHPTRRGWAEGYLAGTGENYPIITSTLCPPDRIFLANDTRVREWWASNGQEHSPGESPKEQESSS